MRFFNVLDQEPQSSKTTSQVSSFSRLFISTVLSSLLVSGAMITTVLAQQSEAEELSAIEEIIVTAQRREQSLQQHEHLEAPAR